MASLFNFLNPAVSLGTAIAQNVFGSSGSSDTTDSNLQDANKTAFDINDVTTALGDINVRYLLPKGTDLSDEQEQIANDYIKYFNNDFSSAFSNAANQLNKNLSGDSVDPGGPSINDDISTTVAPSLTGAPSGGGGASVGQPTDDIGTNALNGHGSVHTLAGVPTPQGIAGMKAMAEMPDFVVSLLDFGIGAILNPLSMVTGIAGMVTGAVQGIASKMSPQVAQGFRDLSRIATMDRATARNVLGFMQDYASFATPQEINNIAAYNSAVAAFGQKAVDASIDDPNSNVSYGFGKHNGVTISGSVVTKGAFGGYMSTPMGVINLSQITGLTVANAKAREQAKTYNNYTGNLLTGMDYSPEGPWGGSNEGVAGTKSGYSPPTMDAALDVDPGMQDQQNNQSPSTSGRGFGSVAQSVADANATSNNQPGGGGGGGPGGGSGGGTGGTGGTDGGFDVADAMGDDSGGGGGTSGSDGGSTGSASDGYMARGGLIKRRNIKKKKTRRGLASR